MLLGMFKNMSVFVLVSVPRALRLVSIIHSLGSTWFCNLVAAVARVSLFWSGKLRHTRVCKKVLRCRSVPDMCASVQGQFSFGTVSSKANGKVDVRMGSNPGEEVFRLTLAGPSGGPTHDSSICDCVTLLDHESSRCLERAGPREWQRHQLWPSC